MATNPKAKKIIIWSSVAVVLGVGGYFLFQYFKKKKDAGLLSDVPPVDSNPTPAPSNTPEVSSDRPTSKADIMAFQNYVINVKKDSAILGKFGADGVWGGTNSNTQKAWDKYGADYKKSGSPVNTPTNDKELERSISLILAKASNAVGKATRSYLTSADPTFVKKWAWNIDNDRSAFGWSNGVWRVKTGEQLLNYNPIGDEVKTISDAVAVHQDATSGSSYTTVSKKGTKVGKVEAVKFDGKKVWFYIPSYSTTYKWFHSKYLKKS